MYLQPSLNLNTTKNHKYSVNRIVNHSERTKEQINELILTDECYKQLEELQEIRLSNEHKNNLQNKKFQTKYVVD